MEHESLAGRIFRGVALTLVLVFFMFPIVWIFLMSFQTNEQILRIPPRILFEPTLANYEALISGQLRTAAGNLEITFMRNLWNSFVLSSGAVVLALLLGVPAAYAFARFKFRLGRDDRVHAAVVPLRAAFARAAAAVALLSAARPQRHLCRHHLGLSAHRAAADPVDRARLFRGYQSRHRARLSPCRAFLARGVYAHRGAACRPRYCGSRAVVVHLLLEQFRLRA